MQKYIFLSLFFVPIVSIQSFELNIMRLDQKPLESFFEAQIAEDLSPFKKHGITKKMLASTMARAKKADLVHFRIRNNECTIVDAGSLGQHPRLIHFVSCMHEIAKLRRLPNIEGVISLSDSFDGRKLARVRSSPVFTLCKKRGDTKAIVLPAPLCIPEYEEIYKNRKVWHACCPWSSKQERVFWRGFSTGKGYADETNPRLKLVKISKNFSDIVDASFVGDIQIRDKRVQQKIQKLYPPQPDKDIPGHIQYKYLTSIENGKCPRSLAWQLVSGSIVLRCDSEYIEWYDKGLIPFVHYIPYKGDYSDFFDRVLWLKNNDVQAACIAENSGEFVEENLSNEDIAAYVYRLFTEYAKLQKF
jgi:hypothetical protein